MNMTLSARSSFHRVEPLVQHHSAAAAATEREGRACEHGSDTDAQTFRPQTSEKVLLLHAPFSRRGLRESV